MTADLHIHSSYSDGTETIEEIIAHAKEGKLKTISITDHDTVEGLSLALSLGKKNGVEVIPGIEFSTEVKKIEVHILAYFVDYTNPELLEMLSRVQKDRKNRIKKICDKLKNVGILLDPKKVLALANNDSPGRPHVARAMVIDGIVSSFNEAFNRYLDFRGPAYVPHFKLDPSKTIKLIKRVGGVAVFAHPGVSNCDELIENFVEAGLSGIEAYYPSYSENTINKYLETVKKFNLVATGGSDYHGLSFGRGMKLGDFSIDDSLVEKLKARAKGQ